VFQFERSAMATAAATIASRKSSLLFFILILNRVLTRWRHAMPFSLYHLRIGGTAMTIVLGKGCVNYSDRAARETIIHNYVY
ncbi:hypothetical protein, partial [Nitrosomonas sp.]|uniref:hypothetical protein n=1 Tax=Nitrosomonas sp. TaxID=42353 RepID=UPI0027306073